MKRIVLIVIGILLTAAGLTAFGFAIAYYIRHHDPMGVSGMNIGLYLPRYTAPGVLTAALGIICSRSASTTDGGAYDG